ncbi:hypothetical protein ES703_91659 [subsurface metagenome]
MLAVIFRLRNVSLMSESSLCQIEIDQPPPKERNVILYNLCDLLTADLVRACNSEYYVICFGRECYGLNFSAFCLNIYPHK